MKNKFFAGNIPVIKTYVNSSQDSSHCLTFETRPPCLVNRFYSAFMAICVRFTLKQSFLPMTSNEDFRNHVQAAATLWTLFDKDGDLLDLRRKSESSP